MIKYFLPFPLAKLAKECGYTEGCFACYTINGDKFSINVIQHHETYNQVYKGVKWNHDRKDNDPLKDSYNFNFISAPLYEQIKNWLRVVHSIWIDINTDFLDGTEIYYPIIKGGFEEINLEAECEYFEALNKGLEKVFQILKERK